MNVLLMSAGGGGGNILRSLKTMFLRDLTATFQADPAASERLKRSIATRFLDTNEFSLSDIPHEEKLVIGAATTRRLGSRHNPEVARAALDESRAEIEALLAGYGAVILIGTGGKGTGAGTLFPLAQMARQLKKLVIPVFVRPSFERHEVEKARYDHALKVIAQFDSAKIRLIEILNDRGYIERDPQPQSVVWERMNLPLARGLRGLLYVLEDLSQVDPSDLSMLLAGAGRLRLGFSEIDPRAQEDPSDSQVEDAIRDCWQNQYYAFSRPAGTCLVCIQGTWSNIVDAKIKSRLASLASAGSSESPYNPLYARAVSMPRPWGVTALFGEHTGTHVPIEIDWNIQPETSPLFAATFPVSELVHVALAGSETQPEPSSEPAPSLEQPVGLIGDSGGSADDTAHSRAPTFASFWDFARAVNRSEPAALAIAGNGADCGIPIDGGELRKLVITVWFRSVFPRLSDHWRDRIRNVLIDTTAVPNHLVRIGRHSTRLSEVSYDRLGDILLTADLPDTVRTDLQLIASVGRLWGEETVRLFHFADATETAESSRFSTLLGLRR